MTSSITGRTIVVGYDGSPAARAAVEHALDRATPGGRLVLVHAYQVPADFIDAAYYDDLHKENSQYAVSILDGLERDCDRLAAVDHEHDVRAGSPSTAIAHAAELHDADEIVIGNRGPGPFRREDSVAHELIHVAPCPVTMVPESARRTTSSYHVD
jgi:nucleotide-binding universal stress UspA family protein